MTQAVFTQVPGVGFRFGSFFATLKTAMERRAVYRETVAELNQLSARELGDLGLTRSSITTVAREAAYGA
ncbi:DUF1127 domain-containing protein [Falsirhodobacter sp. alg1]|uniref:DUF1127 domain-containing protein n=1 Tax=Falsirhodobacter sp. alg1 TaxID=1472418 RepID=UPI0005F06F24|nr:DUF1127 domain-containing protein [Falsirhodobacter sp. alg1]